MKHWKMAISSADSAPQTAPILLQGDICNNLRMAADLGYDAIEVHIRENECLDYKAIEQVSAECGAKVCMIITGRLNTEGKCSLIDDRPYVVNAAMEGMKAYIDMAQKLKADIVIGWVKGNIPLGQVQSKYLTRLAINLKELASYGIKRNVKLNLEVINRYEVNIFTTAVETMDFLKKYNLENCYVHLDTFHMGISEYDPIAAIKYCKEKLGYIHIADNTRCYPGSGTFNFKDIMKVLQEIKYEGYLSVECLPYPNYEIAAKNSITYLKKCMSKI